MAQRQRVLLTDSVGGSGDGELAVLLPLCVNLGPFLLGELVGFAGSAIVLAGAYELLHEVAPSLVPIGAKLLARGQIEGVRHVGFWVDVEVGMPELVGPFVVRVRGNHDGRDFGNWK